jgi:hypothetical protein
MSEEGEERMKEEDVFSGRCWSLGREWQRMSQRIVFLQDCEPYKEIWSDLVYQLYLARTVAENQSTTQGLSDEKIFDDIKIKSLRQLQ